MNGKVAAVWILGASVIAAVACSGSDETGNPTAAGGLGGSAGSTAGGVSSGGKASGGKANGGSAGESTSAAGVAGVSAGGAPSAGAGGASGAPPLAQAIVYYSGAATAREIWVMDPDGMNALALTANSDADVDPQLSPDGTKIVFQRSIAGANDIWVMNADGSNEVDLTSDCTENDGQPSWSPDSQFIAYVSRCDDPTYTKLYRAPADGSSPGGLWVVASGGAGGASATDDSNSRYPDWSGQYIAYDSDRSGNFDIWVKFVDDVSAGTNLTSGSTSADDKPAFSPDGQKIAFTSHRDTGADGDIFVMNANGTGVVQLTDNDFNDTEVQWSPDGTKLVFASDRDGNYDIWVMDAADGGNLLKLSPDADASDDRAPYWGYYSP